MYVCNSGRSSGVRWLDAAGGEGAQQGGAAPATAAAGGPPPRAPSPPLRLVAGHGVHLQPLSDAGPGRQEVLAVTTLLGETVRSAACETATAVWTAYTQLLHGVRRVVLADIGAAGAIRMINVDPAETVLLVLPPGARRYGDAPHDGLLPGAAVVVTQIASPADSGHWGFVVSGGPTVPVARRIRCTSAAVAPAPPLAAGKVAPLAPATSATAVALGADGLRLPAGDFGADTAVHAVDVTGAAAAVDVELCDEAGAVVWHRTGVPVPAHIRFVPP